MFRRRFFSVLRDYQEDCIKASLEHFTIHGIKRQAVSLPVGAGKTVILSNLISKVQSPLESANKVLVLAHREELLLQACRQIKKFNPQLIIELEKGEFSADLEKADVVVASVPTLGRRDERSGSCERLKRFNPSQFKCIIIDEAHHSAAPSYRRILDHFGAFHQDSHLLVWGCSATLRRNDHLALGNLFEKVVYHLGMDHMIKNGWLCQPELLQVFTEFDIDSVAFNSAEDDFSLDQLSLTLNTPKRNDLIASTWLSEAKYKRNRKSTIVFAINVAHVYGLAESFQRVTDIVPKIITGKTDSYERAQILSDFAAGSVQILINCSVLTEGTDLPRTDCVLLARPTCNSSLYIQMTGRGLRTHPDKTECLVLDVIDKSRSPKRSLITFPNLLAAQDKASYNTANEESETILEKHKKDKRVEEINFDAVKVKINKARFDAISLDGERLAWVSIPSYPIHVLECPDFRIILMEEPKGTEKSYDVYTAVVTSKKQEEDEGFDGFERVHSHVYRQTIGKSMVIGEILTEIDSFIEGYEINFGTNLGSSILRSAFWRRSIQPSKKQIPILLKAAKKLSATDSEIRAIFSSTKGQAANVITRLNFLKTIQCPIKHTWADIFN